MSGTTMRSLASGWGPSRTWCREAWLPYAALEAQWTEGMRKLPAASMSTALATACPHAPEAVESPAGVVVSPLLVGAAVVPVEFPPAAVVEAALLGGTAAVLG